MILVKFPVQELCHSSLTKEKKTVRKDKYNKTSLFIFFFTMRKKRTRTMHKPCI